MVKKVLAAFTPSSQNNASTENPSYINPFEAMREFTQLQQQFWDSLLAKRDKK